MSTLRDQIVAQVITQLNAATPAGVPQAERSRAEDMPASTVSSIGVRPLKEAVKRAGGPSGPIVRRSLILGIECRARAQGAETVDEALDPLLAWATKALAGSRLGGLAHAAEEAEIHWEEALRGDRMGKATLYLMVDYHTKIDDATVAS